MPKNNSGVSGADIFNLLGGMVSSFVKSASKAANIGAGSLRDAANPDKTDNRPGVYILILDGDVKKAGRAEIGVQKRMQQYYGQNEACGLNHRINEENRDQIRVKWQYCKPNELDELESKLNDKYSDNNSMTWSERRPHSSRNTVPLKI